MPHPYPFPDEAGKEPTLGELLSDPVMHRLLARDGLTADDVRAAVSDWRRASRSKRQRCAA